MNEGVAAPHSHLFTVRLWREEFADGEGEWRGKVTHVLSGETRYFREWGELLGWLQRDVQPSGAAAAADRELVVAP